METAAVDSNVPEKRIALPNLNPIEEEGDYDEICEIFSRGSHANRTYSTQLTTTQRSRYISVNECSHPLSNIEEANPLQLCLAKTVRFVQKFDRAMARSTDPGLKVTDRRMVSAVLGFL